MGSLIDITKRIEERKMIKACIAANEMFNEADQKYSEQMANNLDREILAEIGLTPEEADER